jgi:hypothetical protein
MNLIWIMPAEGEEVGMCNPYAVGIRVFLLLLWQDILFRQHKKRRIENVQQD